MNRHAYPQAQQRDPRYTQDSKNQHDGDQSYRRSGTRMTGDRDNHMPQQRPQQRTFNNRQQ